MTHAPQNTMESQRHHTICLSKLRMNWVEVVHGGTSGGIPSAQTEETQPLQKMEEQRKIAAAEKGLIIRADILMGIHYKGQLPLTLGKIGKTQNLRILKHLIWAQWSPAAV